MAFNPFHTFRKHKKVMFAALTIICMGVFVLSFGPGDIFQRFGFSAKDQQGNEVVATLYGKKVTESDLSKLGFQEGFPTPPASVARDAPVRAFPPVRATTRPLQGDSQ